MTAKRVILRLRESDCPDISYKDLTRCVEAYLTFSGHSAEELAQGRHFFHFQPPNPDIPQDNARFHIIIDIEKMRHSGPLQKGFPHEIYRILRRNGTMWVSFIDTIAILNLLINFVHSNIVPFQNKKEHDNFIHKLRHLSDGFHSWGRQGRKSDMMACDQTSNNNYSSLEWESIA